MDYRSRILAAIDRLQALCRPIDALEVAVALEFRSLPGKARVARELRAMAKAGLVVYDRKASGWRRA